MSNTQKPDHSSDPEHVNTSAESRAHGTHGKGDTREALHQQGGTQPSGSHASPAPAAKGPAATVDWPSEGVAERRAEPRGKDKKKKR